MPVYKVEVKGSKPRVIKASSAAKARDVVATATALTAEQLADALAEGAVLETA